MKKLMITAAAVAMTAGAFASPLVYDYKASAKHMYLKEVNVRVNNATFKVYQKYVKSASLKGYLIVDADGATSNAIQTDMIANNPDIAAMPVATRPANGTAATGTDYGRNRAFLVVQNSKAESKVRFPKLIPAVLDAKWMDTKFNVANAARVPAKSGLTEGYLYAGGDCVAPGVRPAVDLLYPVGGVDVWAERATPAKAFIGDYAWQSIWLFGQYNMPLGLTGMYDVSQAAIDVVEPIPTGFAAGRLFFHDTWLNGAGFGKYTGLAGDEYCCGYAPGDDMVILQSLSGNLKGGLYLCTENGTYFQNSVYAHLVGEDWEDQFFTKRIADDSGLFAPGDAEPQTDLWQDGDLELNTSDCVSGTWSIKYTSRDLDAGVTVDDLNEGLGIGVPANWSEDALGLEELLGTIKGAALRLNSKTIFANNKEIFNYTAKEIGALKQVPLMTPAFAAYYGFLNFK